MSLLQLTGDGETRAVPEPHSTDIIAFRKLIENSPTEERARKELAYVYHIVNPQSPFAQYERTLRPEKIKEAIFGEDSDWAPDEYVEEAIEVYKDITETRLVKLLNSAYDAIDKLRLYFNDIDLTATDKHDKPKFKAKDLIKNLENLGGVVEGLKKLKEQVELEQSAGAETRGGVKTNEFSQ